MKRLGIILGLLTSGLISCATVPAKDSQYAGLKTIINERHDAAKIDPAVPLILKNFSTIDYQQKIVAATCPEEARSNHIFVSGECSHALGLKLKEAFAERYFAADPSELGLKCQEDPLVCDDPQTREILTRDLHNAAIERSRHEKLHALDEWHDGKMTDQKLMEAIHLNFESSHGHLVTHSPDNALPDLHVSR